jgi:hypothetical protein
MLQGVPGRLQGGTARAPAAVDTLVPGQGGTERPQEGMGQLPAAGGTVRLVGVHPGTEGWGRPDTGAEVPSPLAAAAASFLASGPRIPG